MFNPVVNVFSPVPVTVAVSDSAMAFMFTLATSLPTLSEYDNVFGLKSGTRVWSSIDKLFRLLLLSLFFSISIIYFLSVPFALIELTTKLFVPVVRVLVPKPSILVPLSSAVARIST